jgi:hypothetical protein
MSIGTILVIVLVLMLLGALPSWPHSRSWGYYPSGGLGLILVILVVLLLLECQRKARELMITLNSDAAQGTRRRSSRFRVPAIHG